ncbi:MAG TPA: hypothetical protein VF332_08355 [Vicinamibacterales bacterium]
MTCPARRSSRRLVPRFVWPLACVTLLAAVPAAGQTPAGYAGAGLSVGFVNTGASQGATTAVSVAFQPGAQSVAAGAALSVGFMTAPGASTATAALALAFSANPVPTIAALRPPQVLAGRGTFRLIATGTDFVPGATLFWNGAARTTTFVTPAEVHAVIPAADVTASGTASIIVENPVPDLGPSNAATFNITTSAPTFTDDPLTPRVTLVKAVHVTELRQRIDELRARYGLAAFGWTDALSTAGVTPFKAVHVTELRTALGGVYVAAGETPPGYTDPTVVAGTTVVTAAHLAEIRSAIARLW